MSLSPRALVPLGFLMLSLRPSLFSADLTVESERILLGFGIKTFPLKLPILGAVAHYGTRYSTQRDQGKEVFSRQKMTETVL